MPDKVVQAGLRRCEEEQARGVVRSTGPRLEVLTGQATHGHGNGGGDPARLDAHLDQRGVDAR